MTDPLFVLGADAKISLANKATVKLLGYSPSELIGRDVSLLFADPKNVPLKDELFLRFQQDGLLRQFEATWKTKDGDTIPVLLSCSVIEAAAGSPPVDDLTPSAKLGGFLPRRGLVCVAKDITEWKSAQALLSESEERFRMIFDMAPDAIYMKSGGNFTYLNPAALKLFGASRPEELIGKSMWDFFHPDSFETIRERVKQLQSMPGGAVPFSEQKYLRLDGTTVEVETTAAPVRFQGQQGVVVFIRDITERRKMIAEMLSDKVKLDLALKSSGMGVWSYELRKNLRIFDAQVCRILGIDPESFHGSAEEFINIVHPQDRESIQSALQQTIASGQSYAVEYRVVWPDQSVHYICARGQLVRDASGQPVKVKGVIWDVTERKQAEEDKENLQQQFFQAQKMESIGTLASGVAHNFNNILGSIRGCAEMALDDVAPSSRTRRDLERIVQGVESAQKLTEQILSFSRSAKQEIRDVAIRPIIKNAVEMFRASLKGAVEIRESFNSENAVVSVDPNQMQHMILNILTNSYQAIDKAGGVIEVGLSRMNMDARAIARIAALKTGEWVELTIKDNGCGMDSATKERIFEPFFTTKELGQGTGLGLSLVYGVITGYGGKIIVESFPLQGTTFHIFLPCKNYPL
ncbi:MAG: PAS domain S-box protein [Candidatus Omnitrophica bacterium]|nr:PAS domain S-box protein [Candidatus Omnitrophota bacterium]